MRISTKGRYGTRAMVYLGENFGKEPVSLRELAEEEDISVKYMEQIVPLLKKSGLIRSTRGARGGYVLSRRPEKISLGDILVAGLWLFICAKRSFAYRDIDHCADLTHDCKSQGAYGTDDCKLVDICFCSCGLYHACRGN